MQKSESTTVIAHLHSYEQNWNRLVEKVSGASEDDELYLRGLRLCTQDQKIKAHLLLRTLPKSMQNIVDNLRSKTDLTYNDVHTRLLDINVSTNSAQADALFVKKHKKKCGNRRNNSGGCVNNSNNSSNRILDTQQEKCKEIPHKDECSYYWKRSVPSEGHHHNDYSVLKQSQGKLQDKPTS